MNTVIRNTENMNYHAINTRQKPGSNSCLLTMLGKTADAQKYNSRYDEFIRHDVNCGV